MITLKKLSEWRPEAGKKSARVFIIDEKNAPTAGGENLALPEGLRAVFAEGACLELKTGRPECVRRGLEGRLQSDFFLVWPKETRPGQANALSEALLRELKKQKPEAVEILLADDALQGRSGVFYKRLFLSEGAFERYRSSGIRPLCAASEADEDETEPGWQARFEIYWPDHVALAEEETLVAEARVLSKAILTARRLVNEPANVLTPIRLAEEARLLSEAHGFSLEVYDEQAIQEMGLSAFWSVAKGSEQPPRFLVMRWMNQPASDELLALVGKGLTYDSGGYAIKPASGMLTMHADMGGSAAVIGAISALAAMKAPVNVVAVVAACENMISGRAYHNGDILPSLSGKFIEIVNTDAEGRVTLADAICYADTVLKASRIIDIATLTGSVQIALGNEISGVLADDETIWQALQAASDESGDKIWRLPCDEELAKLNRSTRADIKNSGGRPAGSATAGLFCRAFAGGKPWGHLDIAGTAYREKGDALAPEGATGVGVELLYRAALTLFGGKR